MTKEFKSVSESDLDAQETQEWLDALDSVLEREGEQRANFLIDKLIERASKEGIDVPYSATTEYVNTIPVEKQAHYPGNLKLDRTIRSYIRWNAIAMVLKANKHTNVGGHLASYASCATLNEVGFCHFWHGQGTEHDGDMLFLQGHSSPGVYARAFMLNRLTEEQLSNFRQEVDGKGLSSYPHPWLMPDFWQFTTVSLGLGAICAIYSARFMKYMASRGLLDAEKTSKRKVWAVLGDGEMDEVESLGALGVAGREKLDNLIFVVSCNLQRLDGPVRGNGKIIQELESQFRGSGWNVIKVIWGSEWDNLLAKDKTGVLKKRMMECVDGDYQTFKSSDGAYVREHFFNTPELKALVADLSDEDIWRLNRGGHDVQKIFAAYKAAVEHKGQPTVILAKTIKGYGMGEEIEGLNIAHQQKKLHLKSLIKLRDRYFLPIAEDQLEEYPFLKFDEKSVEYKYMHDKRMQLGGFLPSRKRKSEITLPLPSLEAFSALLQETAEGRHVSTTMSLVRIMNILLKDKQAGKYVVPIVPDESRTFGMEGMFRQYGIWNQEGQKYVPQDHDQLMFYKESKTGQVLQEGITESGAMSDWIAAATSYSVHGVPMIPFYIVYSMFGFQRTMDLCWAAGDQRARGFIIGATAGRTTLNGEGLQHEDGHSHILSTLVPNCISYDPTFQYEVAVIVRDGLRRMFEQQEDVYYYITVFNENYAHPKMPEGVDEGILQGMYLFRAAEQGQQNAQVQLLGSGSILNEVIAAADLLKADWGISSNLWSCPSFNELTREGHEVLRWNMLHPTEVQKKSYVERLLEPTQGPVVAATDFVKLFSEQIRPFVKRPYITLGTDGYGRSDTREQLRHFFEVNRYWITVAALKGLADEGKIEASVVASAISKYQLNSEKPNPLKV